MADAGDTIALTLTLETEAATTRLAEDLAAILGPGDVIALDGTLGAGKTTLARALLRAFGGDPQLEVPSPTFTLVQSYDFATLSIAHFDLYRLSGPDDLDEIGFDQAVRDGAALIEWPERAEAALPDDVLWLRLAQGDGPETRVAHLSGAARRWGTRLRRTLAARHFLDLHGWGTANRQPMKRDASGRSIEGLRRDAEACVLMDHAPESIDAAGIARKAARAEAKLAEDSLPFHAMALALAERGFSAPIIHAHDTDQGFLLIEDLGRAFIASQGTPVSERYHAAIDVLAALHALDLPAAIPDGQGGKFALPAYDKADFTRQLSPLLDWGIPHLLGRRATVDERQSFQAAWDPLLDELLAGPRTWALRDYHSPNLMWLPERDGVRRIGLLDFQDTVLMHPAYDVASLAMDARATVPADLEHDLVEHYIALRRADSRPFEPEPFKRAYAIMAAQRNTRILGIFARLTLRDGRPEYLAHIPRVRHYLERALAHPATASLRLWYDRHVPVALS